MFNLSKTQISSLISDLKEKRWINIKYVYKENTKCIEKRIIKVNCPPYPIILKEGIKANNNIPIKKEFKYNNKYINNKNKYSYTNYEQRDYSNFDWNSLNKALLNLFISNSNEITSKNEKTYSGFNSSAKLHYAMEKHYSLEELDYEMET